MHVDMERSGARWWFTGNCLLRRDVHRVLVGQSQRDTNTRILTFQQALCSTFWQTVSCLCSEQIWSWSAVRVRHPRRCVCFCMFNLICGPMPKVMAAQPNIGGALCKSFVVPFLVPRRKVWLTSASDISVLEIKSVSVSMQFLQNSFQFCWVSVFEIFSVSVIFVIDWLKVMCKTTYCIFVGREVNVMTEKN